MEAAYYTISEVAARLQVTRSTIHRWTRDGRLQYVNVGSDKRFTAAMIDAFIAESTRAADAARSQESTNGTVAPVSE